jgi:hypothetical protein
MTMKPMMIPADSALKMLTFSPRRSWRMFGVKKVSAK